MDEPTPPDEDTAPLPGAPDADWWKELSKSIVGPIHAVLVAAAMLCFVPGIFLFLWSAATISDVQAGVPVGVDFLWRHFAGPLMLIAGAAVIGFAAGILYRTKHGGLGVYLAGSLATVGVVQLIVGGNLPVGQAKEILLNFGWSAFSMGFGFFTGVQFESHYKRSNTGK